MNLFERFEVLEDFLENVKWLLKMCYNVKER